MEMFLSALGFALSHVMIMMLGFWFVYLKTQKAAVVDIGWGLGIFICALVYLIYIDGYQPRQMLIAALVGIWGLRMTFFLCKRIFSEKGDDPRYEKLKSDWKSNFDIKLLGFYEFQALLQALLSIPFLIIAFNQISYLSIWEYLGTALFIISVIGEGIADEQLHRFKRDPKNKGEVCQTGLWKYSRHPNYFFEWLIWVAFYIFALGSPNGWMSIHAPLFMYYILTQVTGVPLAEEQSLKSRGDKYREYQKTTSRFFLMPKRQVTES